MKTIYIDRHEFQYKINVSYDGAVSGSWTYFYYGTEIKNYLFFKKEAPKFAFMLPINIENPEHSKGELRDVLGGKSK